MLEKSGGFAALIDRDAATYCPACNNDNPDLENRGYCSLCGAVFKDKMRRRLWFVRLTLLLGMALTVAGPALTLALNWRWTGIALFVLGVVPLVFGVLANWQLADFLLQALAMRSAKETDRFLQSTNRIAAGLLLYFLTALAGCVFYYLYIERPREQREEYQASRPYAEAQRQLIDEA